MPRSPICLAGGEICEVSGELTHGIRVDGDQIPSEKVGGRIRANIRCSRQVRRKEAEEKARKEAKEKVRKEAEKLEEQRIQDECPFVMMVGPTEKVRQRTVDKANDAGRHQLDALEKGNAVIKEEVVETVNNEENPDERHEQEAPKTDKVRGENVAVKEEVTEGEEEGALETDPVDNYNLPGGANVAIDVNLLSNIRAKTKVE